MKYLNKTITLLLLLAIIISVSFILFRPTRIIAVHTDGSSSFILVENPPMTDTGKINWWRENKKLLQEKYGVPVIKENGTSSEIIWDFDTGYQLKKPRDNELFPDDDVDYLYCFEDKKSEANCVDKKNQIMSIIKTKNDVYIINTNNAEYHEVNGVLIEQ